MMSDLATIRESNTPAGGEGRSEGEGTSRPAR